MVIDKRTNPHASMLIEWLDAQRDHAIEILDGLSEEDLRRPTLPSGWSCLGMIGHLAGVERFWFQQVMLGDRGAASEIPVSIEWQVPADVAVETVFSSYRREIERSNSVIRSHQLEAEPIWWPEFFGDWHLVDLHEIILHTMTETAMHAGHLDAARELIDGHQWLVLDV